MRKTELLAKIQEQTNLPKTEIKTTVEALETSIKDGLVQEYDQGKVKLSIGYFYLTANGQLRFSASTKVTREIKERLETGEPKQAQDSAPTAKVQPKTRTTEAQSTNVKTSKGIKKNALRNQK